MVYPVPQVGEEWGTKLWDSGDGKRTKRGPVVGPVASNDLVSTFVAVGQMIVAGELDGRFHGLGTRVHEENFREVTGSKVGNHGGGFNGWRVG